MKAIAKRLTCVFAVFAVTLSCTLYGGGVYLSADEAPSAQIEYPALRLEYDSAGKPSKTMAQALPLGNGYMGANVYGGVKRDEIQINEHTLWSGGPGASATFDGGMNDLDAATVRQSLQTVRRGLQDEMTEFSANKAAYKDASGNVITYNYSANAQYISEAIENLKGEKTNFGSYQTFGSFFVEEINADVNRVKAVASNELATQLDQQASKLFDGDTDTKWYSLAGTPAGTVQPMPCQASVQYYDPVTFDVYTVVSGNDAPGRDPKHWKLYGSDDGRNWTLIDERDDVVFAERKTAYEFKLASAVTYECFKFETLEIAGAGDGVQASELIFGKSDEGESAGVGNYLRALDLDNGIASVDYEKDETHFSREYFVSYPNNVAAMRLTNDKSAPMSRRIYFESPQTNKTVVADASDRTIAVTGAPADQTQAEHLKFAGRLKVVLPSGGEVVASGEALEITGASEIIAYWTTGTNYVMCMDDTFDYFSDADPLDAVSARVNAAAEKGYTAIRAEHTKDYTELFGRVKFAPGNIVKPSKTTDKLIDDYISGKNSRNDDRYYELLYYQFGRYLLVASSREGTLPANLQGVWCNELNPSWDSDYHTNINLQMNYWAAETANLAECHISEIEYIKSLVPRGTKTAEHYHCKSDGGDVRGWTTYHENSIWGNTAPGNYAQAFYFPTAAAWLCQDIYDYYAFNCDDGYLDDYYDVIKYAALFWVDNLVEDERDGKLVSSPAYSPEHGPFSLGTSADQSLVWELFRNTLELAEAKGDTSSEITEIREAMDKLSMPQIGLGGQLMEWKDETTLDITGDNRHRHINHLLGVYPGTYIVNGRSETDNAYADAVKETLRVRGDMPEGSTINWAFAWKSVVYAKLFEGDSAYNEYKRLITAAGNRGSVGDNLFDVYGGYVFQIDANLGGVSAVSEMLLSSTGNRIIPLAALPAEWRDGAYEGLRARGDFTVDAKWSKGRLDNMTILSGSGKACTLAYDDLYYAQITCDGKPVKYTVNADDTITFATEAGKTYRITQHANHKVVARHGARAASCSSTGYTGDRYCETCSEVLVYGGDIPLQNHNYNADGECSVCGQKYVPDIPDVPDVPGPGPDTPDTPGTDKPEPGPGPDTPGPGTEPTPEIPQKPSGASKVKEFPAAATVSLIVAAVICVGLAVFFTHRRRKKYAKTDNGISSEDRQTNKEEKNNNE